jgi:hypothetical protein
MTDETARQLQDTAINGNQVAREWAWEQLYAAFRPMMFRLVPPWVPESDREDWIGELHEHMMRGVRQFDGRPNVKLSTFVFGCMRMAQQHLVEKYNTHKRAMSRPGSSCHRCDGTGIYETPALGRVRCAPCDGIGIITGTTSLHAAVGSESDGDPGELVEFLMDTKAVNPEQWAMFAEFLGDVDNVLEPVQVPIWRWLLDMGGDVNAVARWLHLPVREVRATLNAVRRYIQENRMPGDPLSHRVELA